MLRRVRLLPSQLMKSKSSKPPAPLIGPEPAEPQVGRSAIPLWLVMAVGVLFYLGSMYLEQTGGGFHAEVFEPHRSIKVVRDLQPKDEGGRLIALGKAKYEQTCQLCHQATGLGVVGQFPPLAGSEWVTTPGIGRLTRIILHGVSGPIEVKGVKWEAAMPPFGSAFTDEEIAAIMAYIRTQKDWGNSASSVKVEDVAAIRKATGDRAPWTADELLKIPESE